MVTECVIWLFYIYMHTMLTVHTMHAMCNTCTTCRSTTKINIYFSQYNKLVDNGVDDINFLGDVSKRLDEVGGFFFIYVARYSISMKS